MMVIAMLWNRLTCGLSAKASLDCADGYNRWLYDYCQYAPERLKAVGLVSRHDVVNMGEQLQKSSVMAELALLFALR
jgi:hypothetical protein